MLLIYKSSDQNNDREGGTKCSKVTAPPCVITTRTTSREEEMNFRGEYCCLAAVRMRVVDLQVNNGGKRNPSRSVNKSLLHITVKYTRTTDHYASILAIEHQQCTSIQTPDGTQERENKIFSLPYLFVQTKQPL